MEKVMLTKEQAHEFESFKALRNSLEDWARDKHDSNALNSIIHELTFDQMARAFLIGYEIEPEKPKFQPGDKVVKKNGNTFFGNGKSITTITDSDADQYYLEGGTKSNGCYLKLATPEEIYWFETLGRKEICDFHKGDIFIDGAGDPLLYEGDVEDLAAFPKYYAAGDFRGIYPAESFKAFSKEETK